MRTAPRPRLSPSLLSFILLTLFACGGAPPPAAAPVAPAVAPTAPPATTDSASASPATAPTAGPPVAAVRPVVDSYFGVSVTDPYRWMETPESPELASFLRQQDAYARPILARPAGRAALLDRIRALGDAGDALKDVKRAGRWVFGQRRPPGANDFRLVVRDGVTGAERVLVDPGTRATPTTHYALDWYTPSLDGRLVAYGLSAGGSENSVLYVVDTASGHDQGESIDRAQYGGVAWLPDGKSFFFTREQKLAPGAPPTDRYLDSRAYLHHLGSNADSDTPVLGAGSGGSITFADSDIPFVSTLPGSRWAFAIAARGSRPEFGLYVAPLAAASKPKTKWTRIVEVEDGVGDFAVRGDDVFLLSHRDAPRSKVLHVRADHPDVSHAEVLLPQSDLVLQGLTASADGVYVQALDAGIGRLLRLPANARGNTQTIALPFDGALRGLVGDPDHAGVLVRLEGWLRAPAWLSADAKKVEDTHLLADAPVDTSALTSLEVKVPSTDGAQVPLSILMRKDAPLDGTHATLLNGYGSYGVSLTPTFRRDMIPWLERGGVFAIAHARGGGELGEEWHQAGRATTKQHTIDDFLACARWLVANKYTSPGHLAGSGGSAGGITIGNAIVQAPDLFAAALIVVGDTNTLRAEFGTDGAANAAEYGSVKTEEGFRALYSVDAFQHVKDGTPYPAVLLSTGANDPRVAVWQPAKMTARLQAATSSGKPVLLRVDFDAGHGVGSSRKQSEELLADQLSFILAQTGDPEFAR